MANLDINQIWGAVRNLLPTRASVDGTGFPVRLSPYGEVMTKAVDRRAMSEEGTYFFAHNITNDAATTLAGHPAPVLADADATMTKPLIHMINNSAVTAATRCVLDFIQIECITPGTNGTAANWAAQLDTGATRIASGTVETLVNLSANMQWSATSGSDLVVKAGPIVTGVESANVRNLGFGMLRPAIEVAGDITTFCFGGDPIHATAAYVVAAPTRHMVIMPPVVLGPTDQLLLALYAPSQTAASIYKVRCGWWQK